MLKNGDVVIFVGIEGCKSCLELSKNSRFFVVAEISKHGCIRLANYSDWLNPASFKKWDKI